jgi:hypothetical protein
VGQESALLKEMKTFPEPLTLPGEQFVIRRKDGRYAAFGRLGPRKLVEKFSRSAITLIKQTV